MILAAGRGKRLSPLTDTCPKPLIEVAGKSLIEYHIHHLANAGIKQLVINTGWLGEQLPQKLGSGKQFGVEIQYSHEGWPALETAGGIIKALPLLGHEPFLVVNADIYTDFDFATLSLPQHALANLVLVDNPAHNPKGDFSLNQNKLQRGNHNDYTFSGVGIYHPSLFHDYPTQAMPLLPILRHAIGKQQARGEHFKGTWMDIGTTERLVQLQSFLQATE